MFVSFFAVAGLLTVSLYGFSCVFNGIKETNKIFKKAIQEIAGV